jgi:hypothetical protein
MGPKSWMDIPAFTAHPAAEGSELSLTEKTRQPCRVYQPVPTGRVMISGRGAGYMYLRFAFFLNP